jgi:hypothetical protein
MCRIASLFFLQRLRGSMSRHVRDFNNIETQASSFSFLQGKASKEIHAILTVTLGGHAPTYATVKNCIYDFYLWYILYMLYWQTQIIYAVMKESCNILLTVHAVQKIISSALRFGLMKTK